MFSSTEALQVTDSASLDLDLVPLCLPTVEYPSFAVIELHARVCIS